MDLRGALPWNWGKKNVPVKTATAHPAAPRTLFELLDELRARPFGLSTPFDFADDGAFLPALDARETDDEIRISVELPGLAEKDVEVSLKDDVLTIRGEKQDETRHGEGDAQWVERRFGSFQRAIPLPADVDPAAVKATFKAGVLTVVAARTGEGKEPDRRIPIRSA